VILDPATLPPALLRHFGGAQDHFLVRLLSRPVDRAIAECEWRARGDWDANNREGFAAYNALRDIIAEADAAQKQLTPPEPYAAPVGWGAAEYALFRGRS
jgi:hypothetical protein